MEGICEFADGYSGALTTETMMVAGVNDADEELDAVARFIAQLHPTTAYITVPTQRPAEGWVSPAAPGRLARAGDIFRLRKVRAEVLAAHTGDTAARVANATAPQPRRGEEGVAVATSRSPNAGGGAVPP
jgi:wyosine [tRNA(Phe)-imidazoG37] synthetase (radical SAM superfamily)